MVHMRPWPPCRVVVAGAPSYLKRRGIAQKPQDAISFWSPTPSIPASPWLRALGLYPQPGVILLVVVMFETHLESDFR